MKRVNIVMIGTGFIAHYHARGLLSLSDVKITAICDTNPAAAEKFASRYNLECILTTDLKEALNKAETDAAIIAAPNKFHLPYALELLNHGKDVFIEKPMAMNTAEAETIIRTAESSGNLVMTGHMWRFDEEVNHIKKCIASGKIGKVIKTKGFGIHENWGPEGWFTRRELSGGGALIDMGVHAIDTVRYLLDDPGPVSVYARLGTFYGNYDVDDTGIVVISWSDGTTSLIESGWWQPYADGPEAATRLYGTEGYASLFPTFIKKNEREQEDFVAPGPEKTEHCDQSIYTRQMAHFADCIRKRKKPASGMETGLTVMKIVDAAYRSSSEKKVIVL